MNKARLVPHTVALLALLGACAKTQPQAKVDAADTADSTTIEVVVAGIAHHEGRMLLALFASPDGFPDDAGKAQRRLNQAIAADSVVFAIPGVPAGRYAVSILHDENANGKMETDFFGRPNEGYGFSRNARGTMGPPGFDDAAFYASPGMVRIRIDLVYH